MRNLINMRFEFLNKLGWVVICYSFESARYVMNIKRNDVKKNIYYFLINLIFIVNNSYYYK